MLPHQIFAEAGLMKCRLYAERHQNRHSCEVDNRVSDGGRFPWSVVQASSHPLLDAMHSGSRCRSRLRLFHGGLSLQIHSHPLGCARLLEGMAVRFFNFFRASTTSCGLEAAAISLEAANRNRRAKPRARWKRNRSVRIDDRNQTSRFRHSGAFQLLNGSRTG
jgi:hypothetical protein